MLSGERGEQGLWVQLRPPGGWAPAGQPRLPAIFVYEWVFGLGGGRQGGLVQANGIPAWPPAFLCDVHFQALNFTIWKMHSAERVVLALRASACQEGMEGPEELGGESGETDLERRGRGWLLSS